jgi:hypothetical protein
MNRARHAVKRAAALARPAAACAALLLGLGATVSARQSSGIDLAPVLQRAGERVAEFFTRAQSIMCLEKVSLQRLGFSWSADGPPRFVESELRLSWEPTDEDPVPTEAKTLRQVLRVNGSRPRKNDYQNCTTPEQNDTEEQPLSLLLPQQREKYTFSFEKREQIDGRDAFVIAYREIAKPKVDVSLVEDKEDCISFDIEGGIRGRVWIDTQTHDVLRLDRGLTGLITIPLPRKAVRGSADSYWTMERWDSSIRFKRVAFQDPEETLVLPVSATTLQITRGAGTPRLRTSTQYVAYRRFMTAGRILPQ